MPKLKLALNPDTTPLSISDTLVFKSLEERAREAFASGFHAVNVDRNEPGLTPEKVLQIVSRFDLEVASGFFSGHLQHPSQEKQILESALEQADFSARIGQTVLFVSLFVSPPERSAVAGRVKPGTKPCLSDTEFTQVASVLNRIGKLWQGFGIRCCFHPHVATYVEAPHEIDELMRRCDPAYVQFGADTGHILYGGGDPLVVIEKYFDRLGALHLKDVRLQVLERVRREGLSYRQACALGVWTELGCGDVDLRGLFELLEREDWSGWVIVETDHTALPTALESSRHSRSFLRQAIGI